MIALTHFQRIAGTSERLPIRLAAADTVIFLDLPAITCLAGIAQ